MSVSVSLKEKIERYYQNGILDESFVMKATKDTLGGNTWKSKKEEDMYKHIDFWWDSPKMGIIGIDVKGIKTNKQGTKKDDTINWLEFKNVGGNKGWLYGEAKYIAFRTFTKIIFCDREKLAKWAESKIEGKELVYENPHEFYQPYQRFGRKDIVIKVPTSDLEFISSFCIEC